MVLIYNAIVWILVIIASVIVYNELDGMLPLLVVLFVGLIASTIELHFILRDPDEQTT